MRENRPQVPCGGRSIGSPARPVSGEFLRLRHLPLPVRKLEPAPNPEIVNGQNVGPSKVENQGRCRWTVFALASKLRFELTVRYERACRAR